MALSPATFGVLLGAPTLRLRGDYLAIVTLGFGEIVRDLPEQPRPPVNITNGPKGITGDRSGARLAASASRKTHDAVRLRSSRRCTLYYYLFLLCCAVRDLLICYRLQHSRIGRAWMAIREDEIAAKAMGINTRNLKLLAFAMGASFGGVVGRDVRRVPGLRVAGIVHALGIDRGRWRWWCWAASATCRA